MSCMNGLPPFVIPDLAEPMIKVCVRATGCTPGPTAVSALSSPNAGPGRPGHPDQEDHGD